MTETIGVIEQRKPAEVAVELVDADIHPVPRSYAELREYLPEPWRSRKLPDRLFSGDKATLYVTPQQLPGARADAKPPAGGPNGSDPDFAAKQLFEDLGVDYAIMNPLTVPKMANPEHEAARAAATNNWQAELWLSANHNPHGRFRGSIVVPSGDVDLAVREIERWAGHPYFAQVLMNPYVGPPFGEPAYYPIWEAATRHNLPIGLHFSRSIGLALLTPVGFSSFLVEHHALYCMPYAAQCMSLLMSGVFERFPTLAFSFIEGGSAWAGPLIWRLDHYWQALRSELPQLKRRPSEYVRDHLWFSSQPIEEPSDRAHLLQAWERMDAAHTLLFASDYPHWDGDYRPTLLFRGLPEPVQRRILRDNALDLYRLPGTRPA